MDVIKNLRGEGVRITSARRLIIEVMLKSESPMSLKEIHEGCAATDFATVYRNIMLLLEKGFAQEVRLGEKAPMYALKTAAGHQHYIKCEKCDKIREIDVCFLETIKQETGYQIHSHSMEFVGICPNCQKG